MLEEDQLLEITNDGGLECMLETTSNLHIFLTKVQVGYPKISIKTLKSLHLFQIAMSMKWSSLQ